MNESLQTYITGSRPSYDYEHDPNKFRFFSMNLETVLPEVYRWGRRRPEDLSKWLGRRWLAGSNKGLAWFSGNKPSKHKSVYQIGTGQGA